MCMTPKVETPPAPIVPESVKRVASDQRRTVANVNQAAQAAAGQTRTTGPLGLAGTDASGKKSLLGA
jgi:hypothetical protein